MKVTLHVAQNTNGRRSAIDGRTTRHSDYAVSQRIRKRIEEAVRDQDGRRTGEDEVARSRSRRMGLHLQRRRLQSRAASEAADSAEITAPAGCQQIGRWRIRL